MEAAVTKVRFLAKNSDGDVYVQDTDIPNMDLDRLGQAIVNMDHYFAKETLTRYAYQISNELPVFCRPEDYGEVHE